MGFLPFKSAVSWKVQLYQDERLAIAITLISP
ncbi:hypothetical protein swp_4064 [Shewanella piezotolerans WP3]|uniref:Uncharacterized protein n=1 Tax=Shewanella piezotolerans (strain WP3 / JCM 13877) TaxID=225849 RepID=B8CSV5_SHEPW|nr:hypothetical protein swp_4064 [Shewanella piezotolerans WP3]